MVSMNSIDFKCLIVLLCVVVGLDGMPRESSSEESSWISPSISAEDNELEGGGSAPIHTIPSLKGEVAWGYEKEWKELLCSVKADPVATFSWRHKGQSVSNSERIIIQNPEDNFSILKVKIHESTLGEYTCRAENSFGASERNIVVGQASQPPIPEFRTMVVSAPNAGIGIHITGFQVRRSHHPITMADEEAATSPSPGVVLQIKGYSVQIRRFRSCNEPWVTIHMHMEKKLLKRGLIAGTKYRMRIAAKTDAGIGEYSRPQTIHFSPTPQSQDENDSLS